MRLVLFFKYYTFAVIRRLLRRFVSEFYYETKYGLKFFSKKQSSPSKSFAHNHVIQIDPHNLYLGIDGLFDDFSLVGVKIPDSPHYNLIVCSEKKDLTKCEYVRREEKGCLDSRDFKYVPFKKHLEEYARIKKEMSLNCTKPISFYTVNGKKYVKDGKHRAALFAYWGKTVPAIEIDKIDVGLSGFEKKLYEKLANPKFSRHKEILMWLFDGVENN